MRQLEPILSGDDEFEKLRKNLLFPGTIRSTPAGADVYMTGYDEPDREWHHLGQTPEVQLPTGHYRFRVSKTGFVPWTWRANR